MVLTHTRKRQSTTHAHPRKATRINSHHSTDRGTPSITFLPLSSFLPLSDWLMSCQQLRLGAPFRPRTCLCHWGEFALLPPLPVARHGSEAERCLAASPEQPRVCWLCGDELMEEVDARHRLGGSP